MDPLFVTRRVDALVAHPRNAEFFDDMDGQKWEGFLKSVSTRGVIVPITITQNNVIVSGHQRVRACKALGIDTIEAYVRYYDNEDAILKDMIEANVRQRGELTGNMVKLGRIGIELERLYGVQNGGDRKSEVRTTNGLSVSQSTIADKLGIDTKTLQRAKRLAQLPPEFQQLIEEERISASTGARFIASMDADEQRQLLEQIIQMPEAQRITQRQIESITEAVRNQFRGQTDQMNEMRAQLEAQNAQIEELRQREPEIIERTVEVRPDDYESLKQELVESLQAQQRYANENSDLRMKVYRFEERERESPEGSYQKRFDTDAIFLHSKCNTFLSEVSKYMYVINEPENMKPARMKLIAEAIINIYGWAQNIMNVLQDRTEYKKAMPKGESK